MSGCSEVCTRVCASAQVKLPTIMASTKSEARNSPLKDCTSLAVKVSNSVRRCSLLQKGFSCKALLAVMAWTYACSKSQIACDSGKSRNRLHMLLARFKRSCGSTQMYAPAESGGCGSP